MAREYCLDMGSESYVGYSITPKDDDDETLDELQEMLEDFDERYGLESPTAYYHNDDEPLEFYDDEIVCRLWTPGLSRNFLKGHENDKDYNKRRSMYNNFARRGLPPKVEVVIASMFGADGSWCGYLEGLSSSTKLLDKDGEISKDVRTYITKEEAKKLMKLLKKLNVEQFEGLFTRD